MLSARRTRHENVSASLVARSDAELVALLHGAPADVLGVGGASVVLRVDGVPVFAKRIPMTDRELAHPGSTAASVGSGLDASGTAVMSRSIVRADAVLRARPAADSSSSSLTGVRPRSL